MKHIKPYSDSFDSIAFVNVVTEPISEMIDKRLSFESLKEEAEYLNKIEESIPEDLRLMIEIDLILERGGVQQYLRDMLNGDNRLIKAASKHLSTSEAHKLNESYKQAINELKSTRLNEQAIATNYKQAAGEYLNNFDNTMSTAFGGGKDKEIASNSAPKEVSIPSQNASIDNSTEIDKIVSDDITNTGGDKLLDVVKQLASAITEGGSAWGILHLVLDIVSIVGGFFEPIGIIADIINGILYLIREKWTLAMISFAAAVIPFAGPIIRNIFKAGKAAKAIPMIDKVFVKTTTKGGLEVSKQALKDAAKFAPETKEAITYVAKLNKASLGKIGPILGAFFDKFLGKIVGWVPFIGKPLKKFFTHVGEVFSGFSTKATKFSDDILKGMGKAELEVANDFFAMTQKGGSRIISKGDDLIMLAKDGTEVARMPSHLLGTIGNLETRVGKTQSKYMQEYLKKVGIKDVNNAQKGIAHFYNDLLSAVEANNKLAGVANKIGGKVFIVKKMVPFFIGKQIVKFLQKSGDMGKGATEIEEKAFGDLCTRNMFHDTIKKDLANNPGQVYSVPYVDTFSDSKALDALNQTLNDHAKAFGLPSIGVLGFYAVANSDEKDPDTTKLMNEMYPELKGKKDIIEKTNLKESKNNLKYIKGINEFL